MVKYKPFPETKVLFDVATDVVAVALDTLIELHPVTGVAPMLTVAVKDPVAV